MANAEVQRNACWLLGELAMSEEHRAAIVAGGGIAAAVGAMDACLGHAWVQHYMLRLLVWQRPRSTERP